MQDTIKIFFSEESNFNLLDISVNQQSVQYTKQDKSLVLTVDQHVGVNLLRIKLSAANESFEVVDVKINNVSLRMSLYLSYIDHNQRKYQPATSLTDVDQTWVLPFGSPVSFWLSLVTKKFKHSEFGKNLYERYNIYYPESRQVGSTFPKLIQDYFKYDFDFTVVDKATATWDDIPYLPLKVKLDTTEVYKEIMENLDYFYANKTPSGQMSYNTVDDPTVDPEHWAAWWFGRGSYYLDDVAKFPKFKKFLTDLNIKGTVATGAIVLTKPKSFVSPHVDDDFFHIANYDKISGCACIYIPISPAIGDANIKLAGVGTLPCEPLVFNNDRFVHGVYNDSSSLRVFMSMRVDPNLNSHLFDKETQL